MKKQDTNRTFSTNTHKSTTCYTDDSDNFEDISAPSENTTNISSNDEKHLFWCYNSLRNLATQGFFFTLWHTLTLATDRGLACWIHFTNVDRLLEPTQQLHDSSRTIGISYVWIIGAHGIWHWADDTEISLAHARYPLARELFPFASRMYKKRVWDLRTFEDLVPEGCSKPVQPIYTSMTADTPADIGDCCAYPLEFIYAKPTECGTNTDCSYHVEVDHDTSTTNEHSWNWFDNTNKNSYKMNTNQVLIIPDHFMTRHNIGYNTQLPDGTNETILDYRLYDRHDGESAINYYWLHNTSRMMASRAHFCENNYTPDIEENSSKITIKIYIYIIHALRTKLPPGGGGRIVNIGWNNIYLIT